MSRKNLKLNDEQRRLADAQLLDHIESLNDHCDFLKGRYQWERRQRRSAVFIALGVCLIAIAGLFAALRPDVAAMIPEDSGWLYQAALWIMLNPQYALFAIPVAFFVLIIIDGLRRWHLVKRFGGHVS